MSSAGGSEVVSDAPARVITATRLPAGASGYGVVARRIPEVNVADPLASVPVLVPSEGSWIEKLVPMHELEPMLPPLVVGTESLVQEENDPPTVPPVVLV